MNAFIVSADWAYGLDDSHDLSYIEDTLDTALEGGELDSDKAEEAIAAIDVLARALGKGSRPDACSEG